MSEDLRAFTADVEGGGHPRTLTYDLELLDRLSGLEREQADITLMELANQGDRRAVETLGRARVTAALDLLRAISLRPGDTGTLAARAVLMLVDGDAAAVKRLADGVVGTSALASAVAAFTLRHQEGEDAVRGLLAALESPSSAARGNAIFGLREKLGLQPLENPRQSPLFQEEMRVHSELACQWQPASKRLRATIEALGSGTSPADLGLVYDGGSDAQALERFWTEARSKRYDDEAFARLAGHDRQWAITYLMTDIRDRPEVAAPLARYGIVEALPALEEAAARAYAAKAAIYRSAIEALRGISPNA